MAIGTIRIGADINNLDGDKFLLNCAPDYRPGQKAVKSLGEDGKNCDTFHLQCFLEEE